MNPNEKFSNNLIGNQWLKICVSVFKLKSTLKPIDNIRQKIYKTSCPKQFHSVINWKRDLILYDCIKEIFKSNIYQYTVICWGGFRCLIISCNDTVIDLS